MFGQRVKIEVFDATKTTLVFSTEELRVDFDVRNRFGLNTAKFTIYNLNAETSTNLINGERFVKLSVALHDQEWQVLASHMFVSNAYQETILPNKLTYLFCYDVVTKENFETPVSTTHSGKQTLERFIKEAAKKAGYKGSVTFNLVPSEILGYVPDRKYASVTQATFRRRMDSLARQYTFEYFVAGESIVVQYKPTQATLIASGLADTRIIPVVLDSNNLRSNPKLGPANLEIVSNLDSRIVPTTILDTTNLITASSSQPEEDLQLAKDLLRNTVTSFKRFVCLESRHTGSNYTRVWNTTASAVAPRSGTKMSTANWGIIPNGR
jgi:hypothetical protein